MPLERQPPERLGDHLLITTGKDNEPLHKARAVLIQAYSLLGTVFGHRLVDLRACSEKVMATRAEIEELNARVVALEEIGALATPRSSAPGSSGSAG
jgi:hypothetical protein